MWQNDAESLNNQLSLMLRNGVAGFALVFLVLALFLELRLAFWVSLGIPISFFGALALMPGVDVSINVLSLFGFVLVLGIVVDDAIIVGENIYRHQEEHGDGMRGAIEGAYEIAKPVTFAVLTTVAAFSPLLFVPGVLGKVFRVIPLGGHRVPAVLVARVAEHPAGPPVAHPEAGPPGTVAALPAGLRDRADASRASRLQPRARVGAAVAVRDRVGGRGGDGRHHRDGAVGASRLPLHALYRGERHLGLGDDAAGRAGRGTASAVAKLEAGAARLRQRLLEETGRDYFRHVLAAVGDRPMAARGGGPTGPAVGSFTSPNTGEVAIELLPSEQRVYGSEQLGLLWREATAPIPEAVEVDFALSSLSAGSDVDVQLAGPDVDVLRAAAAEVKRRLRGYAGVYEVTDSFRAGKQEMKLGIKPSAETVGLTLESLGRQVRQAFYGEEAQRIQRGRDDVRVMVRYPRDERRSLGDLENMRIRTPDGGQVPFSQVAVVEPGRGFASIRRVDRNRTVNVTASIDPGATSADAVIADLNARILPEVLAGYPGVFYTFEGAMAEQRDALGGLQRGFTLALLMIFALLAVPLRSYVQPLIIMSAIPFGLIGAVWGHVFLGLNVSIMSMFGLVALTGVVVNDSLIMVDFINRARGVHADVGRLARQAGGVPTDRRDFETAGLALAVREAGVYRFRPILLTSLTTFFGLAPLMWNRSLDASFMVPMAVSLGFGVLFATLITLVLVPTAYMILDDVGRTMRRVFGGHRSAAVPAPGRSAATL